MPKVCFFPGCKTMSTSSAKRQSKTKQKSKQSKNTVALFTAPKDPILRKRWHIASRRADRELREKDFVCELHFTEDCIERYFIVDMGGGKIFQLKRDRKCLKKGSIPTIFSVSDTDSVKKRGRVQKVRTLQDKENGNGNLDLSKKSSSKKYPCQVLTCSVYGCTNSSDKELHGISLHRFPSSYAQRKWVSGVGKNYMQPSRKSAICSVHFTPDKIQQTSKHARLRPGAIPTIFSLDYNADKNDSCSSGIDDTPGQDYDTPAQDSDTPAQDSDEDEEPVSETIYITQEGNDEILQEVSSSCKKMPLKQFISKELIAEGYEEVFGKFVANELKILSCDPPLYLRTKEKIWRVLEEASLVNVNKL